MKALLLAAGFGTRLKPLTEHIPKPLTLFMARPILDIVYDQITHAGIDQVAVNTHHLASAIALHTQQLALTKQPIHISHEREILGTGGSINPLRPWLAGDDLLIFNGDIISSVDLKALSACYKSAKPMAAMVLIPHKEGTTPVFAKMDQVVGIGSGPSDAEPMTFAGIHILGQAFIERMPSKGFFSVIDTYQSLLEAGEPILAFRHQGFWADLGVPRDYLEAHQIFWRSEDRSKLAKALNLNEALWAWDVEQHSLFIGSSPISGVRESFVFGPIGHKARCDLSRCIVYPQTDLTKHSHERDKIISPVACLSLV
jgi:mannose-1-phosphate guanylyltransferase